MTIAGTECKLVELGSVASATGGQVISIYNHRAWHMTEASMLIHYAFTNTSFELSLTSIPNCNSY